MQLESIKNKLKTNSLFVSIIIGFTGFLIFRYIPQTEPLRPVASFLVDSLPVNLFIILFFSFCKIEIKEMIPRRWHLSLAAVQILSTGFFVALLYCFKNDLSQEAKLLLEGTIICTIAPTAASAAVMTGKLGGNESSQTSYTIISNIIAAVFIPLYFPLICTTISGIFLHDFLLILGRIFPVLVLPLILAVVIRMFFPKLLKLINSAKEVGFYFWLITLAIQSARIFESVANSTTGAFFMCMLFLIGFIITLLQFGLGKYFGQKENQRISAGQGLGQKNTVFAIWIAIMFLSPVSAIVPSSYLLWQNLVNAVQMRIREKDTRERREKGLEPYQE